MRNYKIFFVFIILTALVLLGFKLSNMTRVSTPTEQHVVNLSDTSWVWKENPTFVLTFTGTNLYITTDCNNGSAVYSLGSSGLLTISDIATTKMYCQGSRETEFYQILQKVDTYEINNNDLTLTASLAGKMLSFTKQISKP